MVNDPVVEEVRKARKHLENKFGPDTASYLKHIYKEQKGLGARLVSGTGKKPINRKAA